MKKKNKPETRGRKKNLVKSVSMTISLPEPYADKLIGIAATWPGITRAGLASHFIQRAIDESLVEPLKVVK